MLPAGAGNREWSLPLASGRPGGTPRVQAGAGLGAPAAGSRREARARPEARAGQHQ